LFSPPLAISKSEGPIRRPEGGVMMSDCQRNYDLASSSKEFLLATIQPSPDDESAGVVHEHNVVEEFYEME